jgi:Tol biopolymer transport system component
MAQVTRLTMLTLVFLCATSGARDAAAQYFGRNKVEYSNFDFRVLTTEHFDVYHYPAEAESARLAAQLAERWYTRLSTLLGHKLSGRQPLVLYGSQPEFQQTNVVSGILGDGIGGVTDSAKRRIAMPFAPTLGETDRILGHELAHAFQFDMVRRSGSSLAWPLWAVEGMAQYLSRGSQDVETEAWLRDAVLHDLLPDAHRDAARRFSPYRFGHAFWAYLAGRFGDDLVTKTLTLRGGNVYRRLEKLTGEKIQGLYEDFRAAAQAHYDRAGAPAADDGDPETPPDVPAPGGAALVQKERGGRMQLGPAISPDGRRVVFFSERDRVSIDLFEADAASGRILRKLATTTDSVRIESLQAVRSAGAWSHDGAQFVFSAIDRGRPTLVIIDMADPDERREIRLPSNGQILSPAWSPDGGTIAFTLLHGGISDLYLYDLEQAALRQITDDLFADLHPAWSPDGRQIAFATERFTSRLEPVAIGQPGLALMDVATGEVRQLEVFERARHVNPQWSPDGTALYFVADPGGISHVYRLDLATSEAVQLSNEPGGVTGLAETSPALSAAHDVDALALSIYRKGRYEVRVYRGEETARARAGAVSFRTGGMPPAARTDTLVADALGSAVGTAPAIPLATKPYDPDLSLEAIGQPYLSSGGGPLGSYVRGGGSLLFGDLLGERKLLTAFQVGSRARDFAFAVRFLNQEQRLNWGLLAEIEPGLRRVPSRTRTEFEEQPALRNQSEYLQRIQGRVGAMLAYPLNRSQRLEVIAGVRHARFTREIRSRTISLETGRTLQDQRYSEPGGEPATMGEIAMAFVGDTAVYAPTGPIMGGRYRFEVAPSVGGLSYTRVLADYRRYLMPVKPYTIATRLMHLGQYGRDAHDPRLVPTFLGSRYFVRGYGWSDLRCEWDASGRCTSFDDLLGSRLFVGNFEVRAPLLGLFTGDLTYGMFPLEGFVFADSGVVWSRGKDGSQPMTRRFVNSFGAGIRINAGGMPLEFAVVRAMDAPARGWSFDFGFRTGF